MTEQSPKAPLSLVHGKPLSEEKEVRALTIPAFLRDITERFGEREAVVMRTDDDRLSWSYDDLWARSVEVAKALIACGVGKDSRVGVLMTNRPEFLSALFGISLAGGVTVAFSTFSTEVELEHLVKVSDVSILLYEGRVLKKDFRATMMDLEPAIAGATPGALSSEKFPFLTRLVELAEFGVEAEAQGAIEAWSPFLSRGEGIADNIVEKRAASVTPSDPGGIFFSSGTTSLPKGILHAQRAFAVQWQRWPWVFGINEPVRSWTGNGFFWSGNISMIVGTGLSTGGAVILQRFFKEEEALSLLEAEKVSFLNGRPHQWARLQAAANWSDVDLSSIKFVTKGDLIKEHPTVTTEWSEPPSFGTTETMTIISAAVNDPPAAIEAGSFGPPLPGNTLKIIDPDTGELMPLGLHGEMCIKGPTLMMRYLGKDPEECFDGEGFYRSGDGGRVDEDGRFYWEGRLTDMIKTGGANVAPDEVDLVLNNFNGVKRCQTVGVPDDLLGEMVVACIVPVEGVTLDEEALGVFLKERLASFKIPRKVLIFSDDEFAMTGNEKAKSKEVQAVAIAKLQRNK